jgi:hypothetical protein
MAMCSACSGRPDQLGGAFAMFRDFTKDLRQKLAEGKITDDALAELRASGASIIECIFAVRSFRGCDLAAAKQVVHFSSAWADMREQHDRFHDELEEALRKAE